MYMCSQTKNHFKSNTALARNLTSALPYYIISQFLK